MAKQACVNIDSGNDLLPDGTKPLPGPVLANHQWGVVPFTWEWFHRKCPRYLLMIWVKIVNSKFKLQQKSSNPMQICKNNISVQNIFIFPHWKHLLMSLSQRLHQHYFERDFVGTRLGSRRFACTVDSWLENRYWFSKNVFDTILNTWCGATLLISAYHLVIDVAEWGRFCVITWTQIII